MFAFLRTTHIICLFVPKNEKEKTPDAGVCVKRADAGPRVHLRLGQAERRGQLHPLRRGQIPLDLKALLQAGQLRVGENRPSLPPSAVLPRQVCVVLEERGHLHSCGQTRGLLIYSLFLGISLVKT